MPMAVGTHRPALETAAVGVQRVAGIEAKVAATAGARASPQAARATAVAIQVEAAAPTSAASPVAVARVTVGVTRVGSERGIRARVLRARTGVRRLGQIGLMCGAEPKSLLRRPLRVRIVSRWGHAEQTQIGATTVRKELSGPAV